MRKGLIFFVLFSIISLGLIGCNGSQPTNTNTPANSPSPSASPSGTEAPEAGGLTHPDEKHLTNIKQLTFGGENAEAYWSGDGKQIILQSTHGDYKCDQIFTISADGGDMKLVSTGKGRTTCSYFYPDGQKILFASTHGVKPDCPPPPDMSQGYVWAIYPDYDIFTANPDGSDLKPLTKTPGYDAEATISKDGKKIIFTSTRDGDLDLYVMDADGSNVKRLTETPGYDGGAFFSPDGKQIVYRAYHPAEGAELTEYQELLKKNLVRPSKMEIFIMDADGSNQRQLTTVGKANFCPFFSPDGTKIIFSSNHADVEGKGRNFDLFMVSAEDGGNMERITYSGGFDGFPMFSPDGKKLVWASNRNGKARGETNVFVADWVD